MAQVFVGGGADALVQEKGGLGGLFMRERTKPRPFNHFRVAESRGIPVESNDSNRG